MKLLLLKYTTAFSTVVPYNLCIVTAQPKLIENIILLILQFLHDLIGELQSIRNFKQRDIELKLKINQHLPAYISPI